ncbi:hypothetical protein IE4771_PE00095 (plasmid) [Rhizobium etli bv. mimosae str. IE4771]|uniref:Uncharacterized protein n=1 Tax=Rhizobium etli bv. mimosae str. IE4771 TaxID=1432050 RepID=A0A060II96_RHIET|nr:hypothetical protein IE4771_PE00095 [Rhizobium sp. IE4771]
MGRCAPPVPVDRTRGAAHQEPPFGLRSTNARKDPPMPSLNRSSQTRSNTQRATTLARAPFNLGLQDLKLPAYR